jgi:hypothetical protein
MSKTISFTDEEIKELNWVVPMFKDTHEETWSEKEARVINQIIEKLNK